AGAGGRDPPAAGPDAGPRGVRLKEEDRPPRICPGQLAQSGRRYAGSDKISPRGRGTIVVAGGYRRTGRTRRGDHAGRTRPERRVLVLCEPDVGGLKRSVPTLSYQPAVRAGRWAHGLR